MQEITWSILTKSEKYCAIPVADAKGYFGRGSDGFFHLSNIPSLFVYLEDALWGKWSSIETVTAAVTAAYFYVSDIFIGSVILFYFFDILVSVKL